ncbi:MAG: hypothetical protein RR775_19665 [Massilia sp.]|uniref:hypothetical protein n=1 Tax=Massilia sp. TaxID=1882437 RepID=UPI002FC8E7FA
MTVEVYLLAETVGALTYCDCFGSRKVFCPELMAFSPLAKTELNHFLEQWLAKLIAEGRCQPKKNSQNDGSSACTTSAVSFLVARMGRRVTPAMFACLRCRLAHSTSYPSFALIS